MWRAMALFVALLLGAGVYVLVTGGAQTHAAAPEGPGNQSFGFALAAGSVALAATLLASRPRFRFRR